jgi:hypothetical protein
MIFYMRRSYKAIRYAKREDEGPEEKYTTALIMPIALFQYGT